MCQRCCIVFVALQLSRVGNHSEGWVLIYPVPPEERRKGAKDPHPARDPAQSSLSDRGQQRFCQRPHAAGIPHRQGLSCRRGEQYRHGLGHNSLMFIFLLQLEGVNEPVVLQVFVANDAGRVKPHGFYQACRVTGRNTTACKEVDIDGTTVIEIPLEPSNDMTLA